MRPFKIVFFLNAVLLMCITYLSRDSCRNLICKNLGKCKQKSEISSAGFYVQYITNKKRTCIQIYTTVKITYDIKPSKFEVSL